MAISEAGEGVAAQGALGIATSQSSFTFRTRSLDLQAVQQHCLTAGKLWFAGFQDACRFYRAFSVCKRSQIVAVKTGQCFLLNGCIFLGSVYVLQNVVVPTLRFLLGSQLNNVAESGGLLDAYWKNVGEVISGGLQSLLVGICYIFWLYPLYIISFIVNCIWYNEIARHAFEVMETGSSSFEKNPVKGHSSKILKGKEPGKGRHESTSGFQSIMLGIGEQIYSIIMLSAFFIEVYGAGYIPYVGKPLYFLLLTWLYAYYCFE